MTPADNALVGDRLDRIAQCLERAQLPSFVYNDELIFRAEMERLFARQWVFVAHASEIPASGDYVLRKVGLDAVIVTRDAAGDIHVVSNHCRHRGAELCQTDRGNASRFRCPYHGWTFKNNGDWAGAPNLKETYGGPLDPKKWGLLRAAKVAVRQGFIFTALSADAPSFETFLAGAGWMLDAIVGLHPKGMRVIAPPERSRIRTDWKSGAENFSGDAAHAPVAHFSADLAGFSSGIQDSLKHTWRYQLGGGHAFIGQSLVRWIGPFMEYWGYPPHVQRQLDLSRLDDTQRYMVRLQPPVVGNIFPNLSYVRFPFPLTPGGQDVRVFTSFRQWQPVAPGVVELWNWMFAWDFEDEQATRESYTVGQLSFGTAGLLEQDDTALWQGVARGAASPWRRQSEAIYQFHGEGKGFVDPAPEFVWQGPGRLVRNAFDETPLLDFWRHWLSLLREPAEGVSR